MSKSSSLGIHGSTDISLDPAETSRIRRISRRLSSALFQKSPDVAEKEEPPIVSDISIIQLLDSKYTVKELNKWQKNFSTHLQNKESITSSEFKEFFLNQNNVTSLNIEVYINQLFLVLDTDHDKKMSFGEYMIMIGVRCRGTREEKLRWMFSLFDLDGDGELTHSEMDIMIRALYLLHGKRIGRSMDRSMKGDTPSKRVSRIFKRLDGSVDGEKDGKLSLEEFLKLQDTDKDILEMVFDERLGLGIPQDE